MLQPTNLTVVSAYGMTGTTSIPASPVAFCDQCGGLFVQPGGIYYGTVHYHAQPPS